jgi:hypothetical protein
MKSMKYKRNVLVAAVVLLLAIITSAQDPVGPQPKKPRTPDDYKVRTLKTLRIKGSDSEHRTNKEETMLVYGEILPSRVRVKFKGSTRPVPEIKKEVLRQWARLYAGAPEFYTGPYETEVLFVEEGDEHWLAVRTRALPQLKQQVKEGEEVDLFLIRVGAALTTKNWEPMLLVENFQKPN